MYQKPGDYQKAVHEETADFMMCVCLPGIPDGSVGKESPCDAGDPVSIPGLGRSPGEGIGYPLQYSWASLMAQMVNNLPAMQGRPGFNPWVGNTPGEGKGYPLQYSGLENSGLYNPWGHKESDTTERLSHIFLLQFLKMLQTYYKVFYKRKNR